MTRQLSLALVLFAGNWAAAQTYGPQPGAGRAPAAPQAPARSSYAPQQPAGAYATRPAGAQQPIPQQPGGPQQPGPPIPRPQGIPAAQVPPAPQPPAWALQMNPQELAWLDQVLGFWEARSSKVKTFECKFQCWEYNAFTPPDVAQKFSDGVIKYAQPDKGLFRVENLSVYEPPPPMTPPPAKPNYVVQDKTLGEHWVCDGKQVYQFDARSRRVIVMPLPVEMQGKAIADGPLPFMFGAKAETIKARYWVRGLQGAPGKYLLEAVPKSRQDAQNFQKVHIQLDEAEYLPDMLQVFEPNATEQNRYRKTYLFKERKTNAVDVLQFLNIFHREFYEPAIPRGWKKELQADVVSVIAPPGGAPPPQEAQRPAAPQKSLPVPR